MSTAPPAAPTGIPMAQTRPQSHFVSRRALFVAVGAVAIVICAVIIGIYTRSVTHQQENQTQEQQPYPQHVDHAGSSVAQALDEAHRGSQRSNPSTQVTNTTAQVPAENPSVSGNDNSPLPPEQTMPSALSPAEQMRLAAYEADRRAQTTPLATPVLQNALADNPFPEHANTPTSDPPQSKAAIKRDPGEPMMHTRRSSITRYLLPAGTWIHAKLDMKVISELPGTLVALIDGSVRDNDGDLLIPQGSKLIGTYGSRIAYGQGRLQQVWDRIVFPDSSSITLDETYGTDVDGAAGIKDRVNNHTARLLRDAAISTVFSVGIALTQRQPTSVLGYPSVGGTISQTVGQNIAEVGSEATRNNFNREPTIEIRPGKEFNVLTQRDILFEEPYVSERR